MLTSGCITEEDDTSSLSNHQLTRETSGRGGASWAPLPCIMEYWPCQSCECDSSYREFMSTRSVMTRRHFLVILRSMLWLFRSVILLIFSNPWQELVWHRAEHSTVNDNLWHCNNNSEFKGDGITTAVILVLIHRKLENFRAFGDISKSIQWQCSSVQM